LAEEPSAEMAAAGGPLVAAAAGIEARLGAIEAAQQAMQATQQAMQATQQAMQASLQAIQVQLHSIGAADVAQRRAAARRANAAATEAPFVVLPLDDGTAPLQWPAGLNRAALRTMSGVTASALLASFAIAVPVSLDAKRAAIASHIGAAF